jgi:ABC-2 type transport system ATP-binding protein
LLDEPASGLDPRARIEIRELIKELKKMRKTILISSHILPELSDFCTSIGIIEKGELIVAGSISEIEMRLSANRVYRVGTLDPFERLEAHLKSIGITQIVQNNGFLEFACNFTAEEVASVLSSLINHQFRITSFTQVSANLEDLFMKITHGEVS